MTGYEFVISGAGGAPRTLPFPGSRFLVGTGPHCQLRFEGVGLSPDHAEVTVDANGRAWVRDLTGQGKVWVNAEATGHGPIPLGAVLRLGELELEVRSSESKPRRPTIPSGALVGQRYRVVRRLASGGMGEVYLATHVELGRPVALKVMHWELSSDPNFLARFKREAIATTRIGHQHIVDVLDFGQTNDGRTYFAMEHLDGQTLGQALLAGPMPVARAVNVIGQVARALAAAHARGVVHRDLKPDNVMLLQRPEQPDFVKVLDFGVAKVPPASGEAGHTMLGMVMGTPRYMAPEQARGLVVDARADIYSLGLIMYELLTGRPAIAAESIADALARQLAEPLAPLSPGPVEEVPAALEALVFQMAEKDARVRPQSMEEVIQRLRPLEEAPAAATRPTQPSPHPPHPPQAIAPTLSPSPSPLQTPVPAVTVTPAPIEAPNARTAGPWLVAHARPRVLTLLALLATSMGGVVYGLRGAPTAGALETLPATAPSLAAPPTQAPSSPPASPPSPPLASPPPSAPARSPGSLSSRPAVSPPSRRAKVTLRLRSSPPGAEVRSGGKRLGKTPLELPQPTGAEVVFVLTYEGHRPATLTAHPMTDQTLTANLEKLQPAATPPGSDGDDPTVLK